MKRNAVPSESKLTMLILLIQVILIAVLIGNRAVVYLGVLPQNNLGNPDVILGGFVAAVLLGALMLGIELNLIRRLRRQNLIQDEMLRNIEQLNLKMRAQRHDFLNHIQVVYSLLEMKEYEEILLYLDRVYGDIEKLNKFIKTGDAAVNALLQAKSNACKEKGIDFKLAISSNLKGFCIESWELCRILANLIDNAIYASLGYNGDKEIDVEISASISGYTFKVTNKGATIPEDLRNKIFEPNFTTKGDKGEGMGLHIVKETVKENKGRIELVSENDITSFSVIFPRKKQ